MNTSTTSTTHDAGSTTPRVVVMGVSGCGKSTVGALLAARLGVPFIDGDDLHPAANVMKMAAGTPLTDEDRGPWLRAVGRTLAAGGSGAGGSGAGGTGEHAPGHVGAVIACSALRRSYRDLIRSEAPGAFFVHLAGTREQLAARMGARTDHFMPLSLLDSQLATLEAIAPDEDAVVLDIADPPAELARLATIALDGSPGGSGA